MSSLLSTGISRRLEKADKSDNPYENIGWLQGHNGQEGKAKDCFLVFWLAAVRTSKKILEDYG